MCCRFVFSWKYESDVAAKMVEGKVLAALVILAARAGGARVMKSAVRVAFWGALAMGLTAAVRALFRTVV